MISGIGSDIVRTDRIKDAIRRWGPRFIERIYTEDEVAYCMHNINPYPHLAARFAAKESVIKAFGGAYGLTLKGIEVVNDSAGRPSIRLNGDPARLLTGFGTAKIHLSLSHEREYALAFVIIET